MYASAYARFCATVNPKHSFGDGLRLQYGGFVSFPAANVGSFGLLTVSKKPVVDVGRRRPGA